MTSTYSLETLRRDVGYGIRSFVKAPLFTVVTIPILALAIGANTALFSIIHAVLFQPLPYEDPGRLVAVWNSAIQQKGSKLFATYQDFENWKANSSSFAQIEGLTWATGGSTLLGHGPARNVLVLPATLGFFSMLGVPAEKGRTFQKDDLPRGCTVVISHAFWRDVLSAKPDIVNQDLQMDSQSCAVVGIMPSTFVFFPDAAEAWKLITPNSDFARNPDHSTIGVFGRLRSGVTLGAAQAELKLLASQFNQGNRFGAEMQPVAYPLQDEFVWLASRSLQLTLILLFAAVCAILLIACANVANLLLGRSLQREKELAIRAALGASRGRLSWQLLVENLCLSGVASVFGGLIAWGAVYYFRIVNPVQLPPGSTVEINKPVLIFTVALGLITTLLFGFLPAYKAARLETSDVLRVFGRSSQGAHNRRSANVLVIFEVTASLVLLAGASLLSSSIVQFASAPLGFRAAGLEACSLTILPDAHVSPEQRNDTYNRLLDQVTSLPGVQAAALSTMMPLSGGRASHIVVVEGMPIPDPKTAVNDTAENAVTPTYFASMGISLQTGRQFSVADGARGASVAIINEALAKKYFPESNPVGKHIRILKDGPAPTPWLTIVGVVANEKRSSVYQEMGWVDEPLIYEPFAQQSARSANLVLRVRTNSGGTGGLQRQIAAIDPWIQVSRVQTIDELLSRYLRYPRFRAVLSSAFALIAMLLGIVGLYGVLSQLVTQRVQEIGIRVALGAQSTQIIRMVVMHGLFLVSIGIGCGLVLVFVLNRFIRGVLYGVSGTDPLTLISVSFVLTAFAFLAAYIPARRAAKVDPMVALRYD